MYDDSPPVAAILQLGAAPAGGASKEVQALGDRIAQNIVALQSGAHPPPSRHADTHSPTGPCGPECLRAHTHTWASSCFDPAQLSLYRVSCRLERQSKITELTRVFHDRFSLSHHMTWTKWCRDACARGSLMLNILRRGNSNGGASRTVHLQPEANPRRVRDPASEQVGRLDRRCRLRSLVTQSKVMAAGECEGVPRTSGCFVTD